jgi:hypothetical protein
MGYPQIMAVQHAAGTLFNTYTTSKEIINPQAIWQIPANFLKIGDKISIRAALGISNIVTSQHTFTFEVKMGPTSNIVAFTTGAITTTTTAHTTIPAWLEIDLTLRSEGSGTAAQFMGQGRITGQMFVYSGATADTTTGLATLMVPNTAPALGTGFDSTVTNLLDLWCGLSVSSASTGVQVQQYEVELRTERN